MLGVLTIAGGALFGAGAFSQVSAERTVTASTADDANANLVLEANDSSVATTNSNNELTIDASSLNRNATTEYAYAINVTPSPQDNTGSYNVYVSSATGVGDGAAMNLNQTGGSSIVSSGNAVEVTNGNQLDVSVVFNLTHPNTASEVPDSITFVAEET